MTRRKKTVKDIMRNSGSKISKTSLANKFTNLKPKEVKSAAKVANDRPLVKEILKKVKKNNKLGK